VGCPKCHKKFAVGAEEETANESIVEIDEEAEEAREAKPARKRARKSQQVGRKKLLVSGIAGGVALIALATAVVLTVYYRKGRSTPAGTNGEARTADSRGQALPSWEPDPAVLGKLGPEIDAATYHLRLPQGYIQDNSIKMPAPYKNFTWRTPPRPDGSAATLTLVAEPGPPGDALTEVVSRQVADKLLGGLRLGLQQVKEVEFVRGRIQGVDSVLIRWTGFGPVLARVMHGATYVTLINHTLVSVSATDFEPHHATTIPVGEAAALTLR